MNYIEFKLLKRKFKRQIGGVDAFNKVIDEITREAKVAMQRSEVLQNFDVPNASLKLIFKSGLSNDDYFDDRFHRHVKIQDEGGDYVFLWDIEGLDQIIKELENVKAFWLEDLKRGVSE